MLAAWLGHLHFSIGWFCHWSHLCIVGPFFALCAQKRIKTQRSIAGGNFKSRKENLILAEEVSGREIRDPSSRIGVGGNS